MRKVIKICECGCGKEFEVNKRWQYRGYAQRFISGHNLNLVDRSLQDRSYMKTKKYKHARSLSAKKQFKEGKTKFNWQTGKPGPMKGKHQSQEVKDILRAINLGKKLSAKTKKKLRKIALENGSGLHMKGKKLSLETRQKISDAHAGKMPKNNMVPGKYGNIVRGWYDINGKRMFFRSKWEVNYALYLDFLIKQKQIKKWEYEVDTFWFEAIKRGVRSYKPDFKVYTNKGNIEYHEIKGYMDTRSKTKLKRMKIYYPEIKMILIDAPIYNDIKKKLGRLIGFH